MTGAFISAVLGALFGLALAAPPGPMNAVIAEESALRGWSAGFTAGLGAMTADACFLVLSLLGVVTVVDSMPALRDLMVGTGGLLMLFFAYGAIRDARSGVDWEGPVEGRGFLKAFSLAITNPYQLLFWLTVGIGLLRPGTVDVLAPLPGPVLDDALVVETGSPALLVGLFAGIGVWITAFPTSIVVAGRRFDRLAPTIAFLGGFVLGGFGLLFLGDALGFL